MRKLAARFGLVLLLAVAGCGPEAAGGGGDAFAPGADAVAPLDALGDASAFDVAPAPDLPLDVAPDELGADTAPPPVHGPLFDPEGTDFLSVPFPIDTRRREGGGLDLAGYPNPRRLALLEAYLAVAGGLDGFSVAQVVYFAFADELVLNELPALLTGGPEDALQLVDLTEGPTRGQRVPLVWRWYAAASEYLPARVLALRPVPGATLLPGHVYGALVSSTLPASPPLAPPAAFAAALSGEGPHGAALAPLADWLADEPALAAQLVVATVFTVGDPTAELRRIRQALWEGPAPTPARNFKLAGSNPEWFLYDAEYDAPEFLAGDSPYGNEGGGFVFDEEGHPVVQRTVTLRVSISVPRNREMPAAGWPVALTAHGTLGYFHSFAFRQDNAPATALARHGIAATGLDQPLHGTRSPYPLGDDLLQLYSFNFLNPDAGRTVQRQSVVDQIYLLRLLHEGGLVVPAELAVREEEERFDTTGALFFGHSQGGTTGGMLFGVEDRLRGGVLSGAGGGLSTTIIQRKDPLDFRVLVATALGVRDPSAFDEFHPGLALLQLGVDVVDPLGYAWRWLDFDPEDPLAQPRSALLTEGMFDAFTPPDTTEALATAAGIPVLAPYVSWSLAAQALGLAPALPPVEGNLAAAGRLATGALAQYPDDGHFAVFDNDQAFATYSDFLGSLREGPGRVVPPAEVR